MTIRLTSDKVEKLTSLIQNILASASKVKIRSVAQVIGHMVASFPAVKYEPLYYRMLESDKTKALKHSKGNFEAYMVISEKGKTELNWWLINLKQSFNNIEQPPIDTILYSDASLKGWVAALDNQSMGGK